MMTSPAKYCFQDLIPTFLCREFVDLLLPYTLPAWLTPHCTKVDYWTHAIIVPVFKKPGLDTADMANFRPVSNLTFMSKVTERAVARQLHEYVTAEDLLPRCQSVYKK